MRELSLFSGIGGGILGTRHLLGWRTIGYVEINPYCQQILRRRIDDGYLDNAPIFGDIRTFISAGFAEEYQGLADIVTAGFPCQPFSVAGKRQGEMDERNMWPDTMRVIDVVRPQWALLENVPGLLAHRYFGRILGDLAAAGYDAQWQIISAAEVGANHLRKRLWIVANAGTERRRRRDNENGQERKIQTPRSGSGVQSGVLADSQGERCGETGKLQPGESPERPAGRSEEVPDAVRPECEEQRNRGGFKEKDSQLGRCCWWETEPRLGRMADGIPDRLDRLRAIGNGQVPRVAAQAWLRMIRKRRK